MIEENEVQDDVQDDIREEEESEAGIETQAEEAPKEKASKAAKTVMTEEDLFQNLRILEAVLFTAQDLMTIREIGAFFPADTDVELVLEHLQQQYENRGVTVVKRGTGWGLRTAPDLAEKLEIRKVEIKPMSRAAVETLAIIGYHQPVTRAEIEQIRGVTISKSTFEILVAESLIKPGKRRDVPGRPLTWITTQNFLDTFGLESLRELPNLQELKEAGLLSMVPPQLADSGGLQQSLPLQSEDEMAASEEEPFDDNEFAMDENSEETGEAA